MHFTLSPAKKAFLNTFLLVIAYAVVVYGIQYFLLKAFIFKRAPMENNMQWDVGWYRDIAEKGYHYIEGEANNLALYFLFPLVWRISHLGILGISCLNVVFFAFGFSVLCNLYNVSTRNKILWLTIPTVYQAFIPYSEALFFMLASIVIYGIVKKNIWIIVVNLFLLSLTRATYTFMAPAFLAMCLLSADGKYWYKSIGHAFMVYLLPMALGTALFIWYEYKVTGIWFVFFDVAKKVWGHAFNIPILPFSTLASTPTLWIGAIAMFTGVTAVICLINRFQRWLLKNEIQDGLLIASCTYCMMALLVVVFYNPTWATNTTNVSGIFRYTFMNPFFYIVLYHFTNNITYQWFHFIYAVLLANVVWLAFGSHTSIELLLYFSADTVAIVLFMLNANKKLSWPVIILGAFNFILQIQLFQLFLESRYFPD